MVLVGFFVHFHACHQTLPGDLVLLLATEQEIVESADLLIELRHLVYAFFDLDFGEVQLVLFKNHRRC